MLEIRPDRAKLYLRLAAENKEEYLYATLHSFSPFLAGNLKIHALSLTVMEPVRKFELYLTAMALLCAILEEERVDVSSDIFIYNVTEGWTMKNAAIKKFMADSRIGDELKKTFFAVTKTDFFTIERPDRIVHIFRHFICLFIKCILDQMEVNELEGLL